MADIGRSTSAQRFRSVQIINTGDVDHKTALRNAYNIASGPDNTVTFDLLIRDVSTVLRGVTTVEFGSLDEFDIRSVGIDVGSTFVIRNLKSGGRVFGMKFQITDMEIDFSSNNTDRLKLGITGWVEGE